MEKIKNYYHLSTKTVEKIKKDKNIKINSHIYVDKDNAFIWPSITEDKTRGYCYGLKTHIGILVDGTVIPCCLDSNGLIPLGNIFKEELEDILKKEKTKNLQRGGQDRNPCEELCKSCTFKEKHK